MTADSTVKPVKLKKGSDCGDSVSSIRSSMSSESTIKKSARKRTSTKEKKKSKNLKQAMSKSMPDLKFDPTTLRDPVPEEKEGKSAREKKSKRETSKKKDGANKKSVKEGTKKSAKEGSKKSAKKGSPEKGKTGKRKSKRRSSLVGAAESLAATDKKDDNVSQDVGSDAFATVVGAEVGCGSHTDIQEDNAAEEGPVGSLSTTDSAVASAASPNVQDIPVPDDEGSIDFPENLEADAEPSAGEEKMGITTQAESCSDLLASVPDISPMVQSDMASSPQNGVSSKTESQVTPDKGSGGSDDVATLTENLEADAEPSAGEEKMGITTQGESCSDLLASVPDISTMGQSDLASSPQGGMSSKTESQDNPDKGSGGSDDLASADLAADEAETKKKHEKVLKKRIKRIQAEMNRLMEEKGGRGIATKLYKQLATKFCEYVDILEGREKKQQKKVGRSFASKNQKEWPMECRPHSGDALEGSGSAGEGIAATQAVGGSSGPQGSEEGDAGAGQPPTEVKRRNEKVLRKRVSKIEQEMTRLSKEKGDQARSSKLYALLSAKLGEYRDILGVAAPTIEEQADDTSVSEEEWTSQSQDVSFDTVVDHPGDSHEDMSTAGQEARPVSEEGVEMVTEDVDEKLDETSLERETSLDLDEIIRLNPRPLLHKKAMSLRSSMIKNDRTSPPVLKRSVSFADDIDMVYIALIEDGIFDDLYYTETQLADFRYSAFLETCGLDPAEFE